MQKEFEEASFALNPGEISPVIQTASGLHLIERYVSWHTPTLPDMIMTARDCTCEAGDRAFFAPKTGDGTTNASH